MVGGAVVSWKRDFCGNLIERENANPILNSRWYGVGFDDGEAKELTDNVIAKRMYDQCDEDGNDLLLIDSFIE